MKVSVHKCIYVIEKRIYTFVTQRRSLNGRYRFGGVVNRHRLGMEVLAPTSND